VEGVATIGEDNRFFPYSTVGSRRKFEVSGRAFGDAHRKPNKIREFITIHRGMKVRVITRIGDDTS